MGPAENKVPEDTIVLQMPTAHQKPREAEKATQRARIASVHAAASMLHTGVAPVLCRFDVQMCGTEACCSAVDAGTGAASERQAPQRPAQPHALTPLKPSKQRGSSKAASRARSVTTSSSATAPLARGAHPVHQDPLHHISHAVAAASSNGAGAGSPWDAVARSAGALQATGILLKNASHTRQVKGIDGTLPELADAVAQAPQVKQEQQQLRAHQGSLSAHTGPLPSSFHDLTEEQIAAVSFKDLAKLMAKSKLTKKQVSEAKALRRRAKNRMSARRCCARKRTKAVAVEMSNSLLVQRVQTLATQNKNLRNQHEMLQKHYIELQKNEGQLTGEKAEVEAECARLLGAQGSFGKPPAPGDGGGFGSTLAPAPPHGHRAGMPASIVGSGSAVGTASGAAPGPALPRTRPSAYVYTRPLPPSFHDLTEEQLAAVSFKDLAKLMAKSKLTKKQVSEAKALRRRAKNRMSARRFCARKRTKAVAVEMSKSLLVQRVQTLATQNKNLRNQHEMLQERCIGLQKNKAQVTGEKAEVEAECARVHQDAVHHIRHAVAAASSNDAGAGSPWDAVARSAGATEILLKNASHTRHVVENWFETAICQLKVEAATAMEGMQTTSNGSASR